MSVLYDSPTPQNETGKQHIGNDCDINDLDLMNLYVVLLCRVFEVINLGDSEVLTEHNSIKKYPSDIW